MSLSDYELALRLQSELSDTHNFSPAKKLKKDHSSIVDREWEQNDPTPDIHVLFLNFDKRFFWSSLSSVEVKWSKRMYSCAGICTYKGKRGGVSISLSFPLLQLRPRKDLVETLLHEMIHAYLFLTANKQDREEHGPLFHEHMRRINKDAGTKITVYHSFHNEVAHYKQHWWRCNGPCVSRKPFFGLVKRSMNRAPGPSDFWYEEHRARCGGQFIKIKEPENYKARKPKSKSKDESLLNKHSLKNTFTDKQKSTKPSSSNKTNQSNSSSSSSVGNVSPLTKYFPKVPSIKIKSISTINLHGFSSMTSKSDSKSINEGNINSTNLPTTGTGVGLKSNKGTLVMNPKPSSSYKADEKINKPEKQDVIPFSGIGHVLAPGGVRDRSRSVLLNMFQNNPVQNTISETLIPNEAKKSSEINSNKSGTKMLDNTSDLKKSTHLKRSENFTTFGSENRKSRWPEIENMISSSAGSAREVSDTPSSSKVLIERASSSSSASSSKQYLKNDIPVVISSDSEEDQPDSERVVSCPVCGLETLGSLINEHLDECAGLETVLDNVQIIDDDTDFGLPNQVECPSCGLMCLEDEINAHLDACLC